MNNPSMTMMVGAVINPFCDTVVDYVNSMDENIKLDILRLAIESNILCLIPDDFLCSFNDSVIVQEIMVLLNEPKHYIVEYYKHRDSSPKIAELFRTHSAYIDNIDDIVTSDEALQCICTNITTVPDVIELYKRFGQHFTHEDTYTVIKHNSSAAYALCDNGLISFAEYIPAFCESNRIWDFLDNCLKLSNEYISYATYGYILYAVTHMKYSYVEIKDKLRRLEGLFNKPLRIFAYIACIKREPFSVTYIDICKEFTGKELMDIANSGVLLGGSMTLEEFICIQNIAPDLYDYLDYSNLRILSGKLTEDEAIAFVNSPICNFYLMYVSTFTADASPRTIPEELLNSKICSIAISKGLLGLRRSSKILSIIDVDDFVEHLY